MSQLAAVMAPGFGTMSVTTRKAKGKPSQRNAFTQLNFPLVDVASEDAQMTAKIPMEEVKLTSSFRNFPALDISDASGGVLEVNFASAIPADVTTVRFVTVGYNGNVPSIVDLRDIPAAAFGENTQNISLSPGKFTVLAYGLIPSESAKASIDINNIHTPVDEAFVSAVELDAMVADGSLVETMTVGANITLAS